LFTRHRRELLEEDLKAVSGLQIVEQNLHRDSGSDKNGCATEDIGVFVDERFRFSDAGFYEA